jgi:NH3-dependent NAD+ synthetase
MRLNQGKTGVGANTTLPWGSEQLTMPSASITSSRLEDLLYPILNLRCTADTEAIRDSVTNFTASAYKLSSSGSIKLSRVAETSIESGIGVV